MAVTGFLGVFGHVVLDQIVTLEKLPEPNTSIQILDRERFFGGTGGNIARVAARLGVRTALASFVGEDFPQEYREALVADGVDVTDLRCVPGHRTPMAWIFSDRRGNQMAIVDQGPMRVASHLEVLTHTVESSTVVHIGTGRPEYYSRVAALASRLGKRIAFDPSQEIHYVYTAATFMRLLRRAEFFFGNESETKRALAFARRKRPADLLEFVRTVVLTRGATGSTVFSEAGKEEIPAVRPRRVVDVTGAGDAYRAGFYAGLSRGFDLRRCGLLGSAVASFVIERRGTQTNIPTWDQAIARLSRFASF
jgi:sugar/nucleoside kinase (ribokinase family)